MSPFNHYGRAVYLKAAAFAIVASIVVALLIVETSGETPVFENVSDTPLLTDEQREEAIATGKTAFDCAGMHYVVENSADVILDGYLDEKR